jgi:hypothetical protein
VRTVASYDGALSKLRSENKEANMAKKLNDLHGTLDPPVLQSWGSIFPPVPSVRGELSARNVSDNGARQQSTPSPLDLEAAGDLDRLMPLK